MNYELLKIRSYKHWDVYLHENQCYLGRVFIELREDESVEDFLAIKGEIRDEFFTVGKEVKAVLKALFNPDKMNYAALSNTSPKIHVHVVPRYKELCEFGGMIFKDLRFGKNFTPYDRAFTIEESTLFKIRDALTNQLQTKNRT